jgi:hypothetical protein
MSDINKILDTDKPESLLNYDQIDIDRGNLEYLVGMDICSYRLPCKTIFGDRSITITQKRFDSKV